LVFHNFSLINYGGDSTILKIKLFLFVIPVETPVATVLKTNLEGEVSNGIIDESQELEHDQVPS